MACWSTKAAISLKRVKIEEKLLWRAYRKSPTLFRFFGSPTYFYFRFRLYGHRDGCFCLIFARTAPQLVLDGTNGLSSSKPCVYCRTQIVHRADIFAIAQLSCFLNTPALTPCVSILSEIICFGINRLLKHLEKLMYSRLISYLQQITY